jgi:hypothetical protein
VQIIFLMRIAHHSLVTLLNIENAAELQIVYYARLFVRRSQGSNATELIWAPHGTETLHPPEY